MEESVNKLGDPTVVGPGTWYTIHLKAMNSIDNKSIREFIDFMHLLADNFPCPKCREHIKQYIKTHPFSDLIKLEKNGRKIGMFKWSWMFHNAVNSRLRKPNMDWETAWDLYSGETEVCSKNCDSIDDIPSTDNKKLKLAQGYFNAINEPQISFVKT